MIIVKLLIIVVNYNIYMQLMDRNSESKKYF